MARLQRNAQQPPGGVGALAGSAARCRADAVDDQPVGAGDLGGVADAQVPPRCRVSVQPLGNGAQVGELVRAEPTAERCQIEPAGRLEREAELGGFQSVQRRVDDFNSDPPVLSSKITLQIRTLICSVVGSGIRFSDS